MLQVTWENNKHGQDSEVSQFSQLQNLPCSVDCENKEALCTGEGTGSWEVQLLSRYSPSKGRPRGNGASRSIWIKSSYFIFLGNGGLLKAASRFPLYWQYSKKARCLVHPIRCLGVEMSFFPTWMIDDNKRLGVTRSLWNASRYLLPSNWGSDVFPDV